MRPIEAPKVDILTSSTEETKNCTVNAANMLHLMHVLSSVYSDLTTAVIREYICNALDANQEAGAKTPIVITPPTAEDPQFTVRDFGHGMSSDFIESVFADFGNSTKKDSNDQIGMMGIGAKCGYAFGSKTFSVTSATKDTVNVYQFFLSDTHTQSYKRLATYPRPESHPTGTTVTVPVPNADLSKFVTKLRQFLAFVEPHLYTVGDSTFVAFYALDPNNLAHAADDVYFPILNNKATDTFRYPGGLYFLFGSTLYKSEVPSAYLTVIKVPMGSLAIAPSREAVQLTSAQETFFSDKVKKVLDAKFKDVVSHFDTFEITESDVSTPEAFVKCQEKLDAVSSKITEKDLFLDGRRTTQHLQQKLSSSLIKALSNQPLGVKISRTLFLHLPNNESFRIADKLDYRQTARTKIATFESDLRKTSPVTSLYPVYASRFSKPKLKESFRLSNSVPLNFKQPLVFLYAFNVPFSVKTFTHFKNTMLYDMIIITNDKDLESKPEFKNLVTAIGDEHVKFFDAASWLKDNPFPKEPQEVKHNLSFTNSFSVARLPGTQNSDRSRLSYSTTSLDKEFLKNQYFIETTNGYCSDYGGCNPDEIIRFLVTVQKYQSTQFKSQCLCFVPKSYTSKAKNLLNMVQIKSAEDFINFINSTEGLDKLYENYNPARQEVCHLLTTIMGRQEVVHSPARKVYTELCSHGIEIPEISLLAAKSHALRNLSYEAKISILPPTTETISTKELLMKVFLSLSYKPKGIDYDAYYKALYEYFSNKASIVEGAINRNLRKVLIKNFGLTEDVLLNHVFKKTPNQKIVELYGTDVLKRIQRNKKLTASRTRKNLSN